MWCVWYCRDTMGEKGKTVITYQGMLRCATVGTLEWQPNMR